jgi:hypothetical protein
MHDDSTDDLPWCRATIARGTVTLNPWSPALITRGPASMVFEDLAETAIADLRTLGDDDSELLVRFVSRSPRPACAIDTLVAWAGTVGYRRIWLADRVVDLDVPDRELGLAEVTCPTCGLEWRDDTPEFWGHVHRAGAFPGFCMACGGSLPEWEVRTRRDAGSVHDDDGRPVASGTALDHAGRRGPTSS